MADAARDLLADLTPDQRDAVVHGDGPLLILAGAGSGKTRVITRRVAHLLQCGVRASNILAITFTNKAAGEMRHRVEQLCPGNRVIVSTFHSLGARLLRQYSDRLNLDRNFTIYDVDDRNKLVADALERLGLDNVKFTPDRIAGAISRAKNALQTPKQFEATAHDFFAQTVAKVYYGYEKRLRAANGMDFDDLLYLPALALKLNEELRAELDARFKYVLIDEYQDTNMAQYEIAKRLSLHHPNLCVVGDPDQCILPGTMVDTPGGPKPIESIREGERVLTAAGDGRVGARIVEKVMANPFRGNVLRIELANGMTVRATPNHTFFARSEGAEDLTLQALSGGNVFKRPHPPAPPPVRRGGRGVGSRADGLPVTRGPGGEVFAYLRDGQPFRALRTDELAPGMEVPIHTPAGLDFQPIRNIGSEFYSGLVYDLTVSIDRNFIAGGVVVHNSIYKWRGSDIRNILDFERDFPAARVITLQQNYRSTKAILHAASAVIDRNKQRKKKSLVTDNPQGESVKVLTFDNGLDEAEGVVVRIKKAVADGQCKYRECAIFLRINALSRTLESAFVKHGVPFQIVKGLAFFDRKENKDILAYLRLLVNPSDTVSFLRVVNEPARGVGKVSLERLVNFANDNELTLAAAGNQLHRIPDIKGKAASGLKGFFGILAELRTKLDLPPHEIIGHVLDLTGYRKMLKETGDEDDAERLANIEEVITAAKQFYDEDHARTLGDFLEQVALASDVDSMNESDCVSVMTFHAAKGLEFPVVYMLACEQGLLPHERSLGKDDDVEEERRLCFVGMTRAMKHLHLSHARMREFRGQTLYAVPSMFLDELPAEVERLDLSASRAQFGTATDQWRASVGPAAASAGYPTRSGRPGLPPIKPTVSQEPDTGYAVGQVVQHDEYGIGQITDVSGFGALRRIKIRFPSAGEKTFVADKVKLKVVTKK